MNVKTKLGAMIESEKRQWFLLVVFLAISKQEGQSFLVFCSCDDSSSEAPFPECTTEILWIKTEHRGPGQTDLGWDSDLARHMLTPGKSLDISGS